MTAQTNLPDSKRIEDWATIIFEIMDNPERKQAFGEYLLKTILEDPELSVHHLLDTCEQMIQIGRELEKDDLHHGI